jgi:hypothetical protein
MGYRIFDDRPGECEGCGAPDYPGQFGPSAKQITWNAVLKLWLCVDCRYQWSNWDSTSWPNDTVKKDKKPSFLVLLEKEHGKSFEGIS